jgi:hypothetical protein
LAVREAFSAARGDLLFILDADLTVSPEQLAKFYEAARSGVAEFVSGVRLAYPMEQEAMRFLNMVANKLFGLQLAPGTADQRHPEWDQGGAPQVHMIPRPELRHQSEIPVQLRGLATQAALAGHLRDLVSSGSGRSGVPARSGGPVDPGAYRVTPGTDVVANR